MARSGADRLCRRNQHAGGTQHASNARTESCWYGSDILRITKTETPPLSSTSATYDSFQAFTGHPTLSPNTAGEAMHQYLLDTQHRLDTSCPVRNKVASNTNFPQFDTLCVYWVFLKERPSTPFVRFFLHGMAER